MQPGPFVGAIFGLGLLACSDGTKLPTSAGSASEGGAPQDATATQVTPAPMRDADAIREAGSIGNAGDLFESIASGTYGSTCTIPASAQSIATCKVGQSVGMAAWCHRRTQFDLYCSEAMDASLGCDLAYIDDGPTRGFAYCCPCDGTDAATGCVNVDPSTYDRSCARDSDCMFIWAGMSCPAECTYVCGGGNAAINVDGEARYKQTLASLNAGSLPYECHCPNESGGYGPVCVQGVCTVPQ